MIPRKPLANRQELAQRLFGPGCGFALNRRLCHRGTMAGATLSPAGFDQDCSRSYTRLPGPQRVGHFFAGAARGGQSPADAGDLPFRAAAHRIKLRRNIPQPRGGFPCVSLFLFLALRPRPLVAAARPTSSAPSSVPPLVRSSPMPRAARRWPVRRPAALPARCATTLTSASNTVGQIDSKLSQGPSLHPQGWFFVLRHGAAGEGPCSRRS